MHARFSEILAPNCCDLSGVTTQNKEFATHHLPVLRPKIQTPFGLYDSRLAVVDKGPGWKEKENP